MMTLSSTVALWVGDNPEVHWTLIMFASWILWKPIRALINQWRMHRRMRKYPQLVVCRASKPATTTNGGGERKSTEWSVVRVISSVGSLVGSKLLSLAIALLKVMRFLLYKAVDLVPGLTSKRLFSSLSSSQARQPASAAPPSMDGSSAAQSPPVSRPVTRSTPPPSALRKDGPSSAMRSKVEFAEHSNGNVRIEQRYYNPMMQADRSMQKPRKRPNDASVSPPMQSTTPSGSGYRPLPSRRPVPPAQAGTSTSSGAHPPASQRVYSTPIQHTARDYSNSVVEYRSFHNTHRRPTGAIVQAPLSEQMRKRRLEDGTPIPPPKRSSLKGRVNLGSTRPRVISTRRAVLNKREREEREDRILKDLNTKRIKKKPAPPTAEETTKTENTATSSKVPAISFGTSPTGDSSSSNATAPPATNFQFGSGSTAAPQPATSSKESSQVPPIYFNGSASAATAGDGATAASSSSASGNGGAAPAAFSFGGSTPAASKPTNDSVPAPLAAANTTGFVFGSTAPTPAAAPNTDFSFGGTSSSATTTAPVPAPVAQTSGFTFGGGASSSTTPAPTFGSAAPAPAPAFNFGGPAPAPAFNFGGPAPAPPPTVNTAPAFSFGGSAAASFDSNKAPEAAPAFGAAPPPALGGFSEGASGASARRRAKARTGRRTR